MRLYSCIFILSISLLAAGTPKGVHAAETPLSDVPLATLAKSGPANIMFVIDDSGSMDFEFMTPENHGVWDGDQDNVYLFEDPGDNNYSRDDIKDMGATMHWKSQWHGYNKMYYNPNSDYTPWAKVVDIANNNTSYDDRSQADAATTDTRSHPMHDDDTLDLTETWHVFENGVLVDDGDSGYTRLGTPWFDQSDGDQDSGIVIGSTYDEGRADLAATGAKWTPNLTDSGNYEVFVNWPGESDNDLKVNYKIHHDGTNDTAGPYNHSTSSTGWKSLGTYNFASGSSGYVELDVVDSTVDSDEEFAADAVLFAKSGALPVNIPRAHYYVWSDTENCPYLVILDSGSSSIKYYKADGSSLDNDLDNKDDEITSLIEETNPPADVETSRTYNEEMQNFANWYSFYRRRELTSNAAIGNVIDNISDVNVGIYTIHGRINQSVLPVNTDASTLLDLLYGGYASGGTPFRDALHTVGEYYDCGSGGSCAYVSQAEGGECQQSFAVAMTDGFWNGGNPGVGNQDADSELPSSYTDSDGDYLYSDGYSNTLADVAMKYYQTDLSSTLANKVPTSPESVPSNHDPADWQHMVTYGVSFGITGSLNPDDYELNINATNPDYPAWPDPTDTEDLHRVDDLWHASVNGRGKFLNASDPMELVNSLKEIIENIEDRVSSASSVSINGDQLYEEIDGDIRLFQASYSSATWAGDVKRFSINDSTGEVNPTADWSAQNQLDALQPDWDERVIATIDGTNGIPFTYSDLSSSQQSAMNSDSTLVDYLRGDISEDGGTFRNRSSILGDVVHSSPAFHEDIVYVGANDGMLHAFDADTGEELFAYVPNLVFDHLADYAATDYNHNYYVDLTPVIKKGKHILDSDDDYESLLVGGLRKGGKGYYALDITDADTIDNVNNVTPGDSTDLTERVLWEYSNSQHLGYSFSTPAIVRTNSSSHEWVVLFGNGYNSTEGTAQLFILDPDGTLIKRIDTEYGHAAGEEKNGLSSPTPIDVDNDEKVDYVYAGDLKGNMWKFDLTSSDTSNWEVAYENTTNTKMPLFQAKNDSGEIQPITTKPDVKFHPEEHGYLVLFGTGRHLGSGDSNDTSQQSLYGIWDYGDDSDNQEYLGSFDRTSTPELSNQPNGVSLLEQELITTVTASGKSIRVTTDNDADWSTAIDPDAGESPDPAANAGWYFDLPDTKERVVSPVMIRDNKLVFISYVPNSEPCTSGGYSYVSEVDPNDGSRLASPAFDINEDSEIDSDDTVDYTKGGNTVSDVTPTGIRFEGQLHSPAIAIMPPEGKREKKYFSSSTGTIESMTETAAPTGMTFWMEMMQ